MSLAIVLLNTFIAFEVGLRIRGGIFEMVAMSPFAGIQFLNATTWVYLSVAITTILLWLGLIGVSAVRFTNPPLLNRFSRVHRGWGMINMMTIGVHWV